MAPPAAPATPAAGVNAGRATTLAATAALIVLGLAWELWLAPTGRGTWALKVAPLVLALPGLARHRLPTYRWMSLLLWLYVLEGLVRGTSERGPAAAAVTAMAWLQVALATVAFVAATLYIRRRLASTPLTAEAQPQKAPS